MRSLVAPKLFDNKCSFSIIDFRMQVILIFDCEGTTRGATAQWYFRSQGRRSDCSNIQQMIFPTRPIFDQKEIAMETLIEDIKSRAMKKHDSENLDMSLLWTFSGIFGLQEFRSRHDGFLKSNIHLQVENFRLRP